MAQIGQPVRIIEVVPEPLKAPEPQRSEPAKVPEKVPVKT